MSQPGPQLPPELVGVILDEFTRPYHEANDARPHNAPKRMHGRQRPPRPPSPELQVLLQTHRASQLFRDLASERIFRNTVIGHLVDLRQYEADLQQWLALIEIPTRRFSVLAALLNRLRQTADEVTKDQKSKSDAIGGEVVGNDPTKAPRLMDAIRIDFLATRAFFEAPPDEDSDDDGTVATVGGEPDFHPNEPVWGTYSLTHSLRLAFESTYHSTKPTRCLSLLHIRGIPRALLNNIKIPHLRLTGVHVEADYQETRWEKRAGHGGLVAVQPVTRYDENGERETDEAEGDVSDSWLKVLDTDEHGLSLVEGNRHRGIEQVTLDWTCPEQWTHRAPGQTPDTGKVEMEMLRGVMRKS